MTRAPYLRATVSGRHSRADLVLPTDEPVALLVPQLLSLLEEPQELGAVHLATSLGVVLDPATPLGEAGLVDGVRLHLVTAQELPPAPLVHDLVDVVERGDAPGRWDENSRSVVLAGLGGLLVTAGILGGVLAVPGFEGAPALAAAATLLALSGAAAALRRPSLAWLSALLGIGTAALLLARTEAVGPLMALSVAGLAAVGLSAAAWCSGRLVAGATSVASLAGLTLVGAATWVLTRDTEQAAAVLATVAVLVLGLVPRLALGASGVFGIDGRIADGEEVATVHAEAAVVRAHWTLAGGVVVIGTVFAGAAFWLGRGSELAAWPAALCVVLSLALALRGRHFPLAMHRAALWAAALAGPLGLAVAAESRWAGSAPLLASALAALGVLVALSGIVGRTPLQQARARKRGNQLETAAILLSVPTVLGVFGVYQDLLRTFQ